MGKKGKNTVKNAQPKLDEDHAILDKAIEDAKIERSKMAQEDLKVQVESSALARTKGARARLVRARAADKTIYLEKNISPELRHYIHPDLIVCDTDHILIIQSIEQSLPKDHPELPHLREMIDMHSVGKIRDITRQNMRVIFNPEALPVVAELAAKDV